MTEQSIQCAAYWLGTTSASSSPGIAACIPRSSAPNQLNEQDTIVTQRELTDAAMPSDGWPLTCRDLHRLAARLDRTAVTLKHAGLTDLTVDEVYRLECDIVCLSRQADRFGEVEDLPVWVLRVGAALRDAFEILEALTDEGSLQDSLQTAGLLRKRAEHLRRLADQPDAPKPMDVALDREEILTAAWELRALASTNWASLAYWDTPGWAVLLGWHLSDWPARLEAEDDPEFMALVGQAELLLYDIALERTSPDTGERLKRHVNKIARRALAKRADSNTPPVQTTQILNDCGNQTEAGDHNGDERMKIDLNDLRRSKQRRQLTRLLDDERRTGIEADPGLVRRLRCTLRAKAEKLRKPDYARLAEAIIEVKGRPGFRKVDVPVAHIRIIRPRN